VVDNPVTFTIGTDNINVNQFSGQGNIIAGGGMTINGNTIDVNSANPARIVINADSIDLATTAVTPGTYTKVVVDGYGRVTTGANPTTLAGYAISDGQPLNANLTSMSAVATAGLLARDSTNTLVTKAVTVSGVGLAITNGSGAAAGNILIASNATNAATAGAVVSRDATGNFSANMITSGLTGNASTATAMQNSRDFSVTGDVTAPVVAFNGTGNVALATTLSATGVAAGTYSQLTVDTKGRVTAATRPTTIAATGVADVYTKTENDATIAALRKEIAELHLYIMSRI
jgi:phage-related tail fiber protein